MMAHKVVLASLMVFVFTAVAVSQDRRSADFETLEGTWIVEIIAPPTAPALILTTFARGGTVVGNGNNAQPVLRSAWQGVWARNSYLDFTSTWQRWNFNAAGAYTTRNELRIGVQVDGTLETFTGAVEVLTLDQGGNVTATRPGTLRATRLNLKPPAR
jgi:hypothetical protein